jgi:hypothetical protein
MQLALDKLKTQKELRALLASLNFYCMFSPRFSFYANPLFDMLKLEKAEFMFGDEHRKMLDLLMDKIRKTPGLSFLNDPNIQGGELKIYADASNTTIGGMI